MQSTREANGVTLSLPLHIIGKSDGVRKVFGYISLICNKVISGEFMIETLENKVDYFPASARVNAVYLMYQENTRRVYIGSSGTPGLRTSRHKTLLKGQRHANHIFQALYNENPNFYNVYYTVETREDAYKLEQALIDYYKPTGLLINLGLDVKAPLKDIGHTSEAKQKISIAKMGHFVSDETRIKIGEANRRRTKGRKPRVRKGNGNSDRRKAVSIEGVKYESLHIASKQLDLWYSTVCKRLNSKTDKWKEWIYV